MTSHGDPPAPTQPDPPSVLLMRALGDWLRAYHRPVDDLNALANHAGLGESELWPLIHAGVRAGYILVNEDDAIRLSRRGWAWYRWDADR